MKRMDKLDLWKKATSIRKILREDSFSPIDIFSLILTIDRLTVVYYPMGNHISGICIKNNRFFLIAINSSMSIGRQRFSMAHELYHLYFDQEIITTICATEIGKGNLIEKQADQFASFLLMPPDTLSDLIRQCKKKNSNKLSVEDIVHIEQHFKVSRQSLLIRLIEEKEISPIEADEMKHGIIQSAIRLGYDDALYKPLPENKRYGTYGYYIQLANDVLLKEKISNGKFDELLLSAFRSDIVYGDETCSRELID